MATTPPIEPRALVIDSNVLIAIYAREQNRLSQAKSALSDYANHGWAFYAPGVIVGEVLFVLCGKLQKGELSAADDEKAIADFADQMTAVLPPPAGEASLVLRAEQVRSGYGCSHSADGLYLALAEELARTTTTELLTFDQGLAKQAAKNAPTVKVNLLIP